MRGMAPTPLSDGPGLTTPSPPAAAPRTAVVHLIHTMAYGGVETAVINWVRKIDRARFDVRLVCFANPGGTETPFVEAAAKAGITVSKIPWSRRKPLFKASRALARLLRECGADILHTHNCYADCVGALAARMAPVKTITTLYVWADLDWKRNLIQRINQFAIRFYDQITAHCEDTFRRSVERGIRAERLKTLICGFETQRVELTAAERSRRRRELGVEDDQVLLANIARLYPEKAQDSLLRTFKTILQECPRARLWVVGVGPLEARLRALCTELGLDSAVTFVGFVEDLPSLLPLVDIQVHPAHIEGVPLAICSGMAAGLPIVASEVGGLPEILDHGRCGVLIPPGDERQFARAVLGLIERGQEARDFGAAARHFIENDYSLTAAVKRVEQTYDEVLGLCDSASSS
jgi:glycosyltransferase involved in cell wall biosynthesis